jgi:hypothetical protein
MGGNYLDLWIGKVSFSESKLEDITFGKIRDANKMMSFLMIDFMDHEM